jgi:hypothetical protein
MHPCIALPLLLCLQMLYDSLSWDCLAVLAAHLPQLQELELAGER